MKKKSHFIYLGFLLSMLFFSNPVHAYSDVDENSPYLEAINYITDLGITQGYADNTFRPKGLITRAEFMKIQVLAKFKGKFEGKGENCFSDVPENVWFSAPICYYKTANIISGYADGNFKPANLINVAEGAKITVKTLSSGSQLKEGKYWYSPFIDFLSTNAYLPNSIKYINQELTRGEVAEMIYRMMQEIHDSPSVNATTLEESYCQKTPENIPANINMDKVRLAWLDLYNTARQKLGLSPYTNNIQLERTATDWSENAEKRGYIDHKRDGQTLYYDYNKITAWFKNLGLEFKNIQGVTYSENINWGIYKCSSSDCTQTFINSIRGGFDFFMSEKGKSYSPHYDSIMNSYFKEIGLGIAIDETSGKYYLTVHYGTAITSSPLPVCGK